MRRFIASWRTTARPDADLRGHMYLAGLQVSFVIALWGLAVLLGMFAGGWLAREKSKPVCGPDRCQSAVEACEAVKAHAAGVEIPHDKELATEFVEAACGY